MTYETTSPDRGQEIGEGRVMSSLFFVVDQRREIL